MRFLPCLALSLTFALPTAPSAQDSPAAILVLDGSRSMWGQIDGTAKITIAQEVVGELLATLPDDQVLGLTVYGHRRKGSCSDIETVVAPAPGTRGRIAEAVGRIKPRGKTPMLDAVRVAAESLDYTGRPATVILVSDGVETCDADPCATARALEAAGADFTAHVIGFDIDDPRALAQMQCLADETGGTFRSAASAAELSRALAVIAEPAVAAPDPAGAVGRIFFAAEESFGDAARPVQIEWSVLAPDGSPAMAPITGDRGDVTLPPGDYTLRARRLSDGAVQDRMVTVDPRGTVEVALRFDAPLPGATLQAPDTGIAGSLIEVAWNGPDAPQDYIDTAPDGAKSGTYVTYEYTAKGNPLSLRLPTEPGAYEIRYVLSEGMQVLARHGIAVTARRYALDAPAQAPVGGTIAVNWTGGGFDEDHLTIAPVGSDGGAYLTYEYVSKGNPVPLRLPLTPGEYELRYINGQDASVGLARPITVQDFAVTLSAPERVAAGAMVEVAHTGPDYEGDYITFVKPGADALDYLTYAYTARGTPLQVPAPETPGTYELRYVSVLGDARIFARQTVVVE